MKSNEYIIVSKIGSISFITAIPADLTKHLVDSNKLISPNGRCWAEEVDARNGLPKWIYKRDNE